MDFAKIIDRKREILRQRLLLFTILLVSFIVFPMSGIWQAEAANHRQAGDQMDRQVFLPVLLGDSGSELPIHGKRPTPLLLGIYPKDYWLPTMEDAFAKEFLPLDKWSGKGISLAGVYHFFEQDGSVNPLLTEIWNRGYTPFVNIYAKTSISNLADGSYDGHIRAWAREFKKYTNNGERMAFLAPLQEMNGYWVPYSGDPAKFIQVFKRIQSIFQQEGVPDGSVRWVFAPNGWSRRDSPSFEAYYPGDAYVDVVAFSAYNFGYHPNNPYKDWVPATEAFKPYLERMNRMAPAKPVIIAQTGTTAYYSNGVNDQAKSDWLYEAYTFAASQPTVIGIIYYNADIDFDWAFFEVGGKAYSGYVEAVKSPDIAYLSPPEVKRLDLSLP